MMRDASATSSASKKGGSPKKVSNRPTIEEVGGPWSVRGRELVMDENLLNFSDPVKDLAKSVGNFTKVLDADGNIIKRVDEENQIEYVKNKTTGKYKKRKIREQQVK